MENLNGKQVEILGNTHTKPMGVIEGETEKNYVVRLFVKENDSWIKSGTSWTRNFSKKTLKAHGFGLSINPKSL